ncbi:MAG: SagB/ThcOx family dehydrogenase [bacterium]
MQKGVGDRFQQETCYRRDELPGGTLQWSKRPEPYKRYPDRPRTGLPAPDTRGGAPLWDTLAGRRSVRDFSAEPLTIEQASQLLWAAQGVTAEHLGFRFRTAPSAGALYPVETYTIVHRVRGIEPGVYHYAVLEHALEQVRSGDYRVAAARAALDQKVVYEAAMVFAWTAVFERCKWKYRQRAYRYIYLDAGHIAQNVASAAVALGLGSCQIGALYDDEVNALLGVDGQEEGALYMTVVGKPA